MQVLVDDLIINYEKTGSGPTILLIHGWADNLISFRRLQGGLSKKYEVISLDLPGFGKSSKPSSAWGLAEYSDFIGKFVAKLNLRVYGFIGHSNGGAVLIYGLARNKLTADRLVLLASAGIRDGNSTKKQTYKAIAKTGKLLTSVLPKGTRDLIKNSYYDKIGSDYLIAPDMKETFKLVVETDVKEDARKLKLPTLLIYGNADEATPVDYGRTFNDLIGGSKLEVINGASHFVHHDQPEQVEQLIEEFLK